MGVGKGKAAAGKGKAKAATGTSLNSHFAMSMHAGVHMHTVLMWCIYQSTHSCQTRCSVASQCSFIVQCCPASRHTSAPQPGCACCYARHICHL